MLKVSHILPSNPSAETWILQPAVLSDALSSQCPQLAPGMTDSAPTDCSFSQQDSASSPTSLKTLKALRERELMNYSLQKTENVVTDFLMQVGVFYTPASFLSENIAQVIFSISIFCYSDLQSTNLMNFSVLWRRSCCHMRRRRRISLSLLGCNSEQVWWIRLFQNQRKGW